MHRPELDAELRFACVLLGLGDPAAHTNPPASPAPQEHTMTQPYIGTKEVLAWPQNQNGREGYAVKYADGYTSWSPKETFDGAYRVAEGDDQRLTFGDAVHFLKAGRKVTREGWNGKGMFLFLVPGSHFTVNRPPLLGIYPEGTGIDYRPHIDMKTAQGDVVPWVASQSDVLAEDWRVID